MRHEEAAAFAAGAEAHLTGKLAVCAGSCGPGNLHLINGLFDCHRSGVPVLAIAAHIPSSEIGIDYFQATHPESLFKECSHYVELVSSPGTAAADPRAAPCAWRSASAASRWWCMPGDVALRPNCRRGSAHGLCRLAADHARQRRRKSTHLASLLNAGSTHYDVLRRGLCRRP